MKRKYIKQFLIVTHMSLCTQALVWIVKGPFLIAIYFCCYSHKRNFTSLYFGILLSNTFLTCEPVQCLLCVYSCSYYALICKGFELLISGLKKRTVLTVENLFQVNICFSIRYLILEWQLVQHVISTCNRRSWIKVRPWLQLDFKAQTLTEFFFQIWWKKGKK